VLAEPHEDVATALEAVAEVVGAAATVELSERRAVEVPSGVDLTPQTIGQAVVALMPEHAIVVDEGNTSGFGYAIKAPSAAPHTALALTGGAIGFGLPSALGAAIAAPDRRVIALQSDGSAMYTNAALWTMARESVDVTIVLFANRRYAILGAELARAGIKQPGAVASSLIDLSNPVIEWAAIAQGMGVPSATVTTTDDFVAAFQRSVATPGPFLIEAVIG
jgi:acetolactate synthase-1/2/3 large subunit